MWTITPEAESQKNQLSLLKNKNLNYHLIWSILYSARCLRIWIIDNSPARIYIF